MKTYIVHICREGEKPDQEPIGIIEEAGSEKKSRFTGFDELCRIMAAAEANRKKEFETMTIKKRTALALMVWLCCHTFPVHAQERAGEVLKQFEQHETAPKPRPATPVIESDADKDGRKLRKITPEDSTPVLIKNIVVEGGGKLLTTEEISAITKPAEGKWQTLAELLVMADRLTTLLRSKGFITSYAYIPAQELKEGLLLFRIAVGTLGEVSVSGNQRYSAGFIRGHLEKLRSEGALSEAGLMRQMLILNEHPSLDVRAALKAGSTPGSSDIALAVQERSSVYGSISYDNYGNRNISQDRFNASFGAGNLALDGDLLTLSGSTGLSRLDIDRLAHGRVEYRAPVNYSGTRVGGHYSNSLYRVGSELAVLDINGKAHVAGLNVTHPLLRQASDSLTLKVGFEYKDISDHMLGSLSSRDRIRTMTMEVSYDGVDTLAGRNLLTLGWVTSLQPLVGGTKASDTDSSRLNAGGGFNRFTLDAMREQHLGDRYRLLLKAGGQYSADPLFVAEQYSLGGAYSIRGYRPSYRSGDSGYSVGAELHLALLRGATPAKTGIIPPVSALSFSLVPFLDHGGVYRNNPQPGELSEAYLTSLGSGLRMNWGPLSARLDWAVPRDGGWLLKRALTTVQVAVSF